MPRTNDPYDFLQWTADHKDKTYKGMLSAKRGSPWRKRGETNKYRKLLRKQAVLSALIIEIATTFRNTSHT